MFRKSFIAIIMFMVATTTFASVNVWIPDTTISQKDFIELPIKVNDVTGLNITAFSFTLSFDATFLTVTSASVEGTLSQGYSLVTNNATSGELSVAAAGAIPLTGQGVLIKIGFKVSETMTNSTTIHFSNFIFNEGQPEALTHDGVIHFHSENVITVTIARTLASPDSLIEVPINVSDLTGHAITAYSFILRFNPTSIIAIGSSVEGTMSALYGTVTNTNNPGEITIAAAGVNPLAGSGILIKVLFQASASVGDSVLLQFSNFVFNEGSPSAKTVNGTIVFSSSRVKALDITTFPSEYALNQNYPNPFNPETKIEYAIPKADKVILMIYDQLGRRIRTLVNEFKPAGEYTANWDCKDDHGNQVASGIYFYQLHAGDYILTRKMIKLQ